MSKRHEMQHQLEAYGEIRDILEAMKNLALMEIRKLTRLLVTQRRVVEGIEIAAMDFLNFYPYIASGPEQSYPVYLLIGSEHGFCGDFNEAVKSAWEAYLQKFTQKEGPVIGVGYRLSTKLQGDPRIVAFLDGASVVEAVETALTRLIEALTAIQTQRALICPLRLTVLSHEIDGVGAQVSVLEPFRRLERSAARFAYPPRLNMATHEFVMGLADHYLFAKLHELFYSSLMAENQRRLQHMENAIRRLEEDSEELLLRRNRLRQEEITEEIEELMLSAKVLRKSREHSG